MRLWDEFFRRYGEVCSCPGCDVTDRRFLTIDHVDGAESVGTGGNSRGRKRKSGTVALSDAAARGWPEGVFRVLCYNCNCARSRSGVNGLCPHEIDLGLMS